MVYDHLKDWKGTPITNYKLGMETDPNTIYRICFDWEVEEDPEELLKEYLASSHCEHAIGLSLGMCQEDVAENFYGDFVEPFLKEASRFSKLKFLFAGEMAQEESELTWIGQGDVGAPILNALPGLEELRARGGEDGEILFSGCRHICLQKLVMESGGVPKSAIQGIKESVFPELEHLEIWLGSDERGGDCSIDDVRSLLTDNPFPKLKYLGLRNSEIVNDIAKEIADAPILDNLEVLDLSGGILQDSGAEALVNSDKIKGLKKLDLHHHFMSEEMMKRMGEIGIEVDVTEQEDAFEYDEDGHYYVAVSE